MNGMITGIATAAILLSIVGVVQNCLALKNEAKLKKMYVKEHDERTRAIWEKVGGQSYWYVSVGMLVAVVVSGYFSPAVSITCLGCLMYFLLVRITLSLYYKDKM